MQMTFFLVAWRVHSLDTALRGILHQIRFLFDCSACKYHKHRDRSRHHACDLRYAYCYRDFWANMATCHFGDVASCKKLYLAASWQCLAGLVSLLGADAECDFLVSELQVIVFISFGSARCLDLLDWLDESQSKENHKPHDMLCSFLMETMMET